MAIVDNNNRKEPFEAENKVTLNYNDSSLSISDIQLLESYKQSDTPSLTSKSGYEMIPYVNNFYAKDMNSLNFYAEIYNSDKTLKEEPFLVKYYIESYSKKLPIADLNAFSRQNPKPVNPILANFPLATLASGNYFLVMEVRNKENVLLAEKQLFFQRSNSFELTDSSIAANISLTFAGQYANKDTLADYIKSLRPVANEIEKDFIDNQVATADITSMQIYFYSFWLKRNKKNPAGEWDTYATSVKAVNNSFGSKVLRIKGYDTDRGRVYLKYGPPSTVTSVLNDQEAYPYIIWHYYTLKGQSNRQFIFYNRDMITDDFSLIHSDATGETNNPRWQYKVFERTKINNNLDENNVGNNRLNENIRNPH
jgi:GWxTD domain-containing protein